MNFGLMTSAILGPISSGRSHHYYRANPRRAPDLLAESIDIGAWNET
jgi:hypothetical protein